MFVSRRTFLSVLEHENIPLRYSKNNPSRTKPLPAYSSVWTHSWKFMKFHFLANLAKFWCTGHMISGLSDLWIWSSRWQEYPYGCFLGITSLPMTHENSRTFLFLSSVIQTDPEFRNDLCRF